MDKKPTIGYMACPDCDHPDAEIKLDKNACAYRFCPECNLQTFTRKPDKSRRMIAKMRPVTPVTVTDGMPGEKPDEIAPAPPVTVTPAAKPAAAPKATPPAAKKQSFDMGTL